MIRQPEERAQVQELSQTITHLIESTTTFLTRATQHKGRKVTVKEHIDHYLSLANKHPDHSKLETTINKCPLTYVLADLEKLEKLIATCEPILRISQQETADHDAMESTDPMHEQNLASTLHFLEDKSPKNDYLIQETLRKLNETMCLTPQEQKALTKTRKRKYSTNYKKKKSQKRQKKKLQERKLQEERTLKEKALQEKALAEEKKDRRNSNKG